MALDRPQSVGTSMFESGSHIRVAGTTFKVKCDRLQITTQCPLVDATGEFDTHTVVKHAGRVTGKVIFFGYAIQDSIIGLSNLPDEDVTVYTKLAHADGTDYRLVRFKMAVSSVSIDWDRKAPVVPIRIEGQITESIGDGASPEVFKSVYEYIDGI